MPRTAAPPPWYGESAPPPGEAHRAAPAPLPAAAVPVAGTAELRAAPIIPTGDPHAAPSAESGDPRAAHAGPHAASRAVAAGVLHAAAAFAVAAVAIGTLAALRLLASGDSRISFDERASGLLFAGFAVGVAAALSAPNRWSTPSLATLVLAVIVSVAWPISGYPLPAALLAVVAIGLALARDRRRASGRTRGWWPASILAGAALVLSATGLAMADTYRLEPTTIAAPSLDAAPAPSELTATPSPESSPTATASPDPAATPPHGASPLPTRGATPEADAAAAEDFVRGYYAALDAKRFDDAWASLSPAVRKSFGGLEKWRAGYAKTLSSRPRDLAVATEGDAVTVAHVLLARDRGCNQTQRFSVKWRLHRSSETWTVDGLTAATLGDPRC